MKYKEIKGDLITLAQEGKFDVIAHGCNCFCNMGAGLAPQMAKAFDADKFKLEGDEFIGDMHKLGDIDYDVSVTKDKVLIAVVNAYTQYGFGRNHKGGKDIPLDYEALTLCMRKINHIFAGSHVGLPQIGCNLAGGDWKIVKKIIKQELVDCDVTVVIYNKK